MPYETDSRNAALIIVVIMAAIYMLIASVLFIMAGDGTLTPVYSYRPIMTINIFDLTEPRTLALQRAGRPAVALAYERCALTSMGVLGLTAVVSFLTGLLRGGQDAMELMRLIIISIFFAIFYFLVVNAAAFMENVGRRGIHVDDSFNALPVIWFLTLSLSTVTIIRIIGPITHDLGLTLRDMFISEA